MQETVEVDRIGQRLSTYSFGHKKGIHPAQRNDGSWLNIPLLYHCLIINDAAMNAC